MDYSCTIFISFPPSSLIIENLPRGWTDSLSAQIIALWPLGTYPPPGSPSLNRSRSTSGKDAMSNEKERYALEKERALQERDPRNTVPVVC